MQVELAQLKHLSTRLVRRKTGLDQQKGAVGLRGPGETQLETDRRLIKVRIAQLQNRLAKVEKQRNQNRQTRQKADIPTISLVGYTMRENRHYSISSHKPMSMPRISFLPLSIPH